MAVKISGEIVNEADKYAAIYSRTVSMQRARIGKMAEENPERK